MADQPINSPATALLPTQQASNFSMALTANELLVAFGVTRLSISDSATGATPQAHVEWIATLSISPVAATSLIKVLQTGIAAYEKQFGKIPADPNFKLTQSI